MKTSPVDQFIKAARRAGRRQWILDLVSARWLRWLPEGVWDWAFDRFARADGEARRLIEDEIRRSGGTVFHSVKAKIYYRERDFS